MRKPDTDVLAGGVRRYEKDIIRWLERLVSIPSENRPPDGNEGPAQDFIEDACKTLGLEVESFRPVNVESIEDHPAFLAGRNYPPERRNVTARWKGRGGGRSLLLSGHVDVAPREPGPWHACRPFEPVLKNGRLYGRGTADMKGGIAACFWAMKIVKELGFEPSGDVLFETVVDEEFAGGNGTLASRLNGFNADLAVLCEPTRMEVCAGSEGAFLGDIVVRGKKGGVPYTGSRSPNPVNAIARIVEHFAQWERWWRAQERHPLFTDPGKELNLLLWNLFSGGEEEVQLGVPLEAAVSWIVWCYPGMAEERFYDAFTSFWEQRFAVEDLAPFDIEIVNTHHFVRPWETDGSSPGVRGVLDAYEEVTGRRVQPTGAPFSCDLALYGDEGGMDSIILGPGGENLHAPDEYVVVEDVLGLTAILAVLITEWCG